MQSLRAWKRATEGVERSRRPATDPRRGARRRLGALLRTLPLRPRHQLSASSRRPGLSMTQCKALLELSRARDEASPARSKRPRRAPRRLAALDEPRGRRPGQAQARHPGRGPRRPPRAAACRSPQPGKDWSRRAVGRPRSPGSSASSRPSAPPSAASSTPRSTRSWSARTSPTPTATHERGPRSDPLPPPDHRREPQVVDARRDVLRAVHDHARQHGRQRRAAVDPARPRARASPASSGPSTATRSASPSCWRPAGASATSSAAAAPSCSA